MKHLACLAGAVAVALATAGGALAENHRTQGGHGAREADTKPTRSIGSFIPRLDGAPPVWFRLLAEFPLDPKPRHRPALHERPRPRQPGHVTTLSLYERNVKPWLLRRQGCRAGRDQKSGVVVLDFGKLAYEHGGYGTILFSDRFAPNRKISTAMLGYAQGYSKCLPQGSTLSVALARGTSNYHPAVPSAYTAGVRWAYWTRVLADRLRTRGLTAHVRTAAADDAEPAWDPHFRKTRDFLHGYRRAAHGRPLYDFGSLDGGVGRIWSARQAFFVAGGIRHTKALPEIYNSVMAHEWAELARVAARRYHRPVEFAGVMTEGAENCDCGLRPHAAHRALARALASAGVDRVQLPRGGTSIVG